MSVCAGVTIVASSLVIASSVQCFISLLAPAESTVNLKNQPEGNHISRYSRSLTYVCMISKALHPGAVIVAYGKPLLDTITKRLESDASIVDEVFHNVFTEPAAIGVLKYQWRVPMVQSHRRLDAIFDASVNNIVIVVDGLLVDWPTAEWQDTRPRQREAVDFDALSGQTGDVFLVQVVVLWAVSTFSRLVVLIGLIGAYIVSYVGSSIIHDVVRYTSQSIPHTGTAAFVLYCAFDLESGTRDSPPGQS